MKTERAFSVLEALVAAAILSVVGIAVVGAMTQTAREVETASDYTVSLLLAQKVMEESLQSLNENPYADLALGEDTGVRRPIRDGGHPSFAAIEDTTAPWGRLEPGKDLAVDFRDATLFRLYREFSLTVDSRDRKVTELPGSPPVLLDLTLTYDWPGLKKTSTRTFALLAVLAKPQITPRAIPEVAEDRDALDEAIRTHLYPDRPGLLSSVAASVGADLAAVRDLGSIVVVVHFGLEKLMSLHGTAEQIRQGLKQGRAANPAALVQMRMKLAKAHERAAALAWKTLLFCKDPARRLSTNLTRQHLGTVSDEVARIVLDVLSESPAFFEVLGYHAASALDSYHRARASLPPIGDRPYWQLMLERKVLELAQLRLMITESPDVSFNQRWIQFVDATYRGRNRFVEAWLGHEREQNTSLAKIRALHPEIQARVSSAQISATALRQLHERARRTF